MANYAVTLAFSEIKTIYLRELTAQDELIITDLGTHSAVKLINGLFSKATDNQVDTFRAESLVTADRDRVLAAIYQHTYSDFLQSTIHCGACNTQFDLDFSLNALISHIQNSVEQIFVIEQKEDSWYELADGTIFRLPTGADELAVAHLPSPIGVQHLLARCLKKGEASAIGEQVQEAMAQIAPVLATEMMANCPECGHNQSVNFDIQSFLLSRLKQDRKQIIWEVHRLAGSYHWSHQEIMNLPRSLRQNYVSLIDSEL